MNAARSVRVIRLTASNVMGLTAASITPDPHMQVVAGRNGQGKSSLLNSIWIAIAGRKAAVDQPVKAGAEKARVRVELGHDGETELVVTRTWDACGATTRLTVETGDGYLVKSPQHMLDALIGAYSYDPLAWLRAPSREQRAQLLQTAGVDVASYDRDRAALYDERRITGRDLSTARGHASSLPDVPEGTPDSEVSIDALIGQLQAAVDSQRRAGDAVAAVGKAKESYERAREEVARAKRALAAAEDALALAGEALDEATSEATLAAGAVIDDAPIRAQLASAEATNQRVRAKQAKARAVADAEAIAGRYEYLTGQIADLDAGLARQLASAELPVEGLTVTDEGVAMRGVPLAQCSQAEQLKVAVALAAAANPQLRVIRITDGALLDDDSLAQVRDLAERYDVQVWVETVGRSGQAGVITIEAGEVQQ